MQERMEKLFSLENLDKLKNANILLVGVGGVGSSCLEVLVRSGIGNISICDYDTYEISNLNRQLHSDTSNIGVKKIIVQKEYYENVNPLLNIKILDEYINENSNIDFTKFNFVIDACDSINAKLYLAKRCEEENISFISSLGVGNRLNINDLYITKLSKTYNDPLAKKMRSEIKKWNIKNDIIVLASKEVPKKISNPVNSYIGVSMSAGILLADYVIKELIK